MRNKRYALCLIVIAVVLFALAIGLAGCRVIKYDENYEFSVREGNSDFYYSQLSQNQQKMYRMLCKEAEDVLYNGVDRKDLGTYNFFDYGLSRDEAVTVWYAFRYDSPAYFIVANSYSYTPTSITVKVAPEFQEKGQRDAVLDAVAKTVEEIEEMLDTVDDDLMKFKVLYDYVMEHTNYAFDDAGNTTYDGYTYTMAGALDGNDSTNSICQGYSEALCYLCNIFDVQCIYVGSEYMQHTLNIININGDWYYVDATSDDVKNQSTPYKYFLKGADDNWNRYNIDGDNESEKYLRNTLPELTSHDYMTWSGDGNKNERHQNGIFNCRISRSDLERGRYVCSIAGYKYYGEDALFGGVVDGVEVVDDIPTHFGVYEVESVGLNYSNSLKSVKVPDGFTSSGAFNDCINLVSVELPQSVTSIEWSAFSGCISLESIEIPSSVTSIGNYAFQGCVKLKSINIPNGVTAIGQNTFDKCSSLESIEIPNTVTTIGEAAFRDCASLKSIEIPDSVYSIGSSYWDWLGISQSYAFENCTSLEYVKLPRNLGTIGTYMFAGCSSLSSIIIPRGVYAIYGNAFNDCDNLTIYCEASSKKDDWVSDWNCSCPVVWGYVAEATSSSITAA